MHVISQIPESTSVSKWLSLETCEKFSFGSLFFITVDVWEVKFSSRIKVKSLRNEQESE